MRQRLEVTVLGSFAARWSDGEQIALNSRKAQLLIAYLAAEGTVSRDALANLLWGDRPEQRARHNVRQTLSKIRRTFGPIIAAAGADVLLDPQRCVVDVTEFLRLAEKKDTKSLQACLNLYGGDLLEGTLPKEAECQDWLRMARDRLRRLACEVLDQHVQQLMAAGEHEQAVGAINRRLQMDPACEPAHRDLMAVLAAMGRRSDAIRQYQVCVDALERELGVGPSAETRALLAQLRASDSEAGAEDTSGSVRESAATTDKPRVAVLPFDNLSGPEDEYFVDGMTEDIITGLSRFHALQVIARSSTFVYKASSATDAEIAAALGARFLVRGSVQRVEDRVRLTLQLLDGPESLTVWGHRYDFAMADIFQTQDEITATVVATLAGRVEATELARARKASPERVEAYDYLLRGKDHHHRFTAADCGTCIDMFNHAIERDPSYAVAHAWLACGLGQAMVWELDDHAALVDRSQAAAERGLELDENESECHRILAQVHLTRGNLTRSLKHQERALFLNPNDDRSICSMGEILCFLGRHKEAESWVRKSMSLNPYHPQRYWTHLARALFHQGRFSEALETLEQIGRPRRDDLAYAVATSVKLGDPDALQRSRDALRVTFPDFDAEAFVASLPYARAADRDAVRDALAGAEL